jgi:ATP-dependent Clp protease adaptor protein ClpS
MARDFESDAGVIEETETETEKKVKRPRMYKVLLHNDDYTTREFVVHVLQSVFHKSEPEAVRIMLHVHNHGVGLAGLYTREVAETKVRTVEQMARKEEYPLRLSMEPEESENEGED